MQVTLVPGHCLVPLATIIGTASGFQLLQRGRLFTRYLFGSRIWYLGRKHNFVTPGDMMEKYYKSPFMRILFAVVGMIGLIPYMLIQVTGGAFSLNSLTNNAIPYWVGILIMGVFVGIIVTLSGGRAAAWADTFMGFFFGTTLVVITLIFIYSAGGFNAFVNLQSVAPEILVNKHLSLPLKDFSFLLQH